MKYKYINIKNDTIVHFFLPQAKKARMHVEKWSEPPPISQS